jgi:hypothetical protein
MFLRQPTIVVVNAELYCVHNTVEYIWKKLIFYFSSFDIFKCFLVVKSLNAFKKVVFLLNQNKL